MYLSGFSLNNLSLMALIVATGLVVDDAIVVLENISRHVELGKPPFEAALAGAREVGSTLLSMNLALVAVFVSILFMGGIIERLFREFSITLVAAITISLVVSLTLTPMLCARWLGHRKPREQQHFWQRLSEGGFDRLRRGYGRSLGWALAHAPLVVCLLLGVILLNIRLYIAAPKSFLPMQDTGQIGGFIRGDDGLSFQVMQPKIDAFRRGVLADPAVESVGGFIGGGRGINNAWTFIRLKPQVGAQGFGAAGRGAAPPDPAAHARRAGLDVRPAGHSLRRRRGRRRLPVHAPRRRLAPAARLGRARQERPGAAAPADRVRRPARDEPAGVADGRSRRGAPAGRGHGDGHPDAQQRVRPAAGLDDLQRAEPVSRRDGSGAGSGQGPEALDRLYIVAGGETVPLSAFSHYDRTVAPRPRAASRAVRLHRHRLPVEAGREPQRGPGRHRSGGRAARHAVHRAGRPGGRRAALRAHAGGPAALPSWARCSSSTSCSACSTRATCTR